MAPPLDESGRILTKSTGVDLQDLPSETLTKLTGADLQDLPSETLTKLTEADLQDLQSETLTKSIMLVSEVSTTKLVKNEL